MIKIVIYFFIDQKQGLELKHDLYLNYCIFSIEIRNFYLSIRMLLFFSLFLTWSIVRNPR